MHKAGILHKDLSIGNILFEADSDKVNFSLVDLNRMDFCKVDKKTGCRNFERLRGNSDFFRLLSNAYSEDMGYDQSDVSFAGVGVEYRIIAEDTQNRFAPWTGRIEKIAWREQDWLKLHSQVPTDREYEIPTDFDPNLALAIIWGKDLAEAKARGTAFLDDLVLEGVDAQGVALKSNIAFLREKTKDLLEF